MNRGQPKLIVFSGIDNAGKSTQINCLMQRLRVRGFRPVYFWSRGGYTGPFNLLKSALRKIFGKKIIPSGRTADRQRAMQRSLVARLWLWLAICDLILVYGIYFRYLIWRGKTIIADRYLFDTWIDFTLNFPMIHFDQWFLWRFLQIILPRPTQLFLLLIPVDESIQRGKLKNEPFPDSPEILEKRLCFYQQYSETKDTVTFDCLAPIESIEQKIWFTLFTENKT